MRSNGMYQRELDTAKKHIVSCALELNGHDITKTSKYLGLYRTHLHKLMAQLGMKRRVNKTGNQEWKELAS